MEPMSFPCWALVDAAGHCPMDQCVHPNRGPHVFWRREWAETHNDDKHDGQLRIVEAQCFIAAADVPQFADRPPEAK